MSHPELSSGGGSSLSSGKLSKLLVSVGDATCPTKEIKLLVVLVVAFGIFKQFSDFSYELFIPLCEFMLAGKS